MAKAIQNLVTHAGIESGEALKMCSLYPAKVMGLDKESGKIEKGYRAEMVLLNEENDVVQLID